MQLIAGLMSDFSDSSQLWWSGVVQVSKDAYDKWVVASPIERLTVEPDDRPELTEGQMGESECPCMRDALGSLRPHSEIRYHSPQSEIKLHHKFLFRLYTTYQPGGTGERKPGFEQLAKSTCGAGCSCGYISVEGVGTVVSKVHRLWYELA